MNDRQLTCYVYEYCLMLRDRNMSSFTAEEFDQKYRKQFGEGIPIIGTGYSNVEEIFVTNKDLFRWDPEVQAYRCVLQSYHKSIPKPQIIELGEEPKRPIVVVVDPKIAENWADGQKEAMSIFKNDGKAMVLVKGENGDVSMEELDAVFKKDPDFVYEALKKAYL